MTAEATEGPYYLPLDLMRSDITEGLAGIPIDIRLAVIDELGEPYVGALVDIWHCDAQGRYSGFGDPGSQGRGAQQGATFLRGVQMVDSIGDVLFHSIYPGWYRGRTTHIHFKVRNGSRANLTSQFFLPDSLSEFVYDQVSAYRRTELRDTLNSGDGIAIEAGDTVQGSVRETDGRYLVTLVVRVDRSAVSSPTGPPPPPPRPPSDANFGFGTPPPGMGVPPNGRQPVEGEERVAALLPNAPRQSRSLRSGNPHDRPARPM